MSSAKVRSASEIYDLFAEQYRSYSDGKKAYIDAVDRQIIERFADKVSNVLDFGAGDGVRGARVYSELKAQSLTQVDISDAMVEKCKALRAADRVFNVQHSAWLEGQFEFDLAMCLWNVLGHVPGSTDRVAALKQIRSRLAPNGMFIFDVNNRHNEGYGYLKSIGRRALDFIAPDDSRGDVVFDWEIDGEKFPASGHFFTPAEVKRLLASSGFSPVEIMAVDYSSGTVSARLTKGQLLVVAKPA